MTVTEAQKIYCIGIGGIGVSALAQFWRAQGKQVSGSDAMESEITQRLQKDGIQVNTDTLHVTRYTLHADLVIYSDAVPEDHPERVAARARGIQELSYAQALGEVSRDYRTVVVTGTHGKSTTTALLGLMLEAAGMDPLVIVGSKVPDWNSSNIRLPSFLNPGPAGRSPSSSSYFIVEGDDYRNHFLALAPDAVVVTNIEYDHPDYFQNLEQTVESFRKLVEKIPEGGFVAVNEDDTGCQHLITDMESERQLGQPFGWTPSNSAIRANRRIIMYGRGSLLFGKLLLQVPGEFNRYNATAAATAAMELGVSQDVVERVARGFKGVWRRFEIVGQLHDSRFMIHNSPTIISDYAHHPTAIRETMKAAREAYPDRRLMLVYQPHQHSRTKRLFKDFIRELRDAADVVIVSEIYAVKGRMEERDVSSRDIVEAIKQSSLKDGAPFPSDILYGGDLAETKRVVLARIQPGDVVIFMGAGDIDLLARQLIHDTCNTI